MQVAATNFPLSGVHSLVTRSAAVAVQGVVTRLLKGHPGKDMSLGGEATKRNGV